MAGRTGGHGRCREGRNSAASAGGRFLACGSRRALSLVVKGGGLATRALVMGLHAFAVRGLDTRPVSGRCQLPEVRVAPWPAPSGRDLRRAGGVGAEFDGLLLWCAGWRQGCVRASTFSSAAPNPPDDERRGSRERRRGDRCRPARQAMLTDRDAVASRTRGEGCRVEEAHLRSSVGEPAKVAAQRAVQERSLAWCPSTLAPSWSIPCRWGP